MTLVVDTSSKMTSVTPFRIQKSRKSTSSSAPRRGTSSPRNTSRPVKQENYEYDDPLDDTGVVASLASNLNFRDVPQFIQYIRFRMFTEIPQNGAGMNSTRIAEVLNYRLALPPIVSVAHIDALSTSSTNIEREIVELAHKGVLRKMTIPSRGIGAAAAGDGVVLVSEWERLVRENGQLSDVLKTKYIEALKTNKTSATIPNTAFTPAEISALTTTGFLTNSTASAARTSTFARPTTASLGSLASLSSSGSKNASGSIGAVGGQFATHHISGGTGRAAVPLAYYNFSLPNAGSHIKLVIESRAHLINLLQRMSRHREAPMNALRERWDGGVVGEDAQSQAKKARGEFKGVLPGRTKKWKQFWGLSFEWVLEECVGAGLVELFETGSVGVGVRAVK